MIDRAMKGAMKTTKTKAMKAMKASQPTMKAIKSKATKVDSSFSDSEASSCDDDAFMVPPDEEPKNARPTYLCRRQTVSGPHQGKRSSLYVAKNC